MMADRWLLSLVLQNPNSIKIEIQRTIIPKKQRQRLFELWQFFSKNAQNHPGKRLSPLFCLPPKTSNNQIGVVIFRIGLPSISSLIWETSDFDGNFRAIMTVNKTVPWVCEESPIFPAFSDLGLDNQNLSHWIKHIWQVNDWKCHTK